MLSSIEMISKALFERGEVVYHRMNVECNAGLILEIRISPNSLLYYVVWDGKSESWHHEIELTKEFTPVIKLTNGQEVQDGKED